MLAAGHYCAAERESTGLGCVRIYPKLLTPRGFGMRKMAGLDCTCFVLGDEPGQTRKQKLCILHDGG